MKLQVVSSDAATVQVNYMGEIQPIPSNVIRFEAGAATQQTVTASATASTTARPPPPAQSSRQQPAGAPEGNWNTYNFINTRLRASPLVHVVDESRQEGDVIQIETRMYEPKRLGGKSAAYQQMENTKLLIPIPFARIILHCAQIGQSRR